MSSPTPAQTDHLSDRQHQEDDQEEAHRHHDGEHGHAGHGQHAADHVTNTP